MEINFLRLKRTSFLKEDFTEIKYSNCLLECYEDADKFMNNIFSLENIEREFLIRKKNCLKIKGKQHKWNPWIHGIIEEDIINKISNILGKSGEYNDLIKLALSDDKNYFFTSSFFDVDSNEIESDADSNKHWRIISFYDSINEKIYPLFLDTYHQIYEEYNRFRFLVLNWNLNY